MEALNARRVDCEFVIVVTLHHFYTRKEALFVFCTSVHKHKCKNTRKEINDRYHRHKRNRTVLSSSTRDYPTTTGTLFC